jgi:hypothetical protein
VAGDVGGIAGFAVIPWLSSRRIAVARSDRRDSLHHARMRVYCPYHAITMVPRTDGKSKFVAQANWICACAACASVRAV